MDSSVFESTRIPEEFYTGQEIWSQPDLWIKLWNDFKEKKNKIKSYLNKALKEKEIRIILTGAGTSSFIGDILFGAYVKNFNAPISSAATTDIVTHPELYFNKKNKYLLISFARSGSSPESSQVVALAESLSKKVYHLVITCNNDSKLLKSVRGKDHFVFLMPPEAHDKGLAMTASFTSMLLAGLLIPLVNEEADLEKEINSICSYGRKILDEYTGDLKKIAQMDFNRGVFLGSGMIKGVARESQLKLQELTDGRVICKYDSFLGFRHGPKAVINEKTLIVYLFSSSRYANKYEADLVKSINEGRKPLCSVGFMEEDISLPQLDLKMVMTKKSRNLIKDFLPVVSVLPAQILGFYKSINLGLKPDSPSDSGMIHRVVQGVKIYPYKSK